eukprot:scaffold145788_cov36-Prasinocladus_malaysianus.AAC.1
MTLQVRGAPERLSPARTFDVAIRVLEVESEQMWLCLLTYDFSSPRSEFVYYQGVRSHKAPWISLPFRDLFGLSAEDTFTERPSNTPTTLKCHKTGWLVS